MEIVRRLFNHKPVLSGEIKLMIECFDKRVAKDDQKLQNVCVSATTLAGKTMPASQQLVAEKLTQIQANALVCLQMCEQILEQDEITHKAKKIDVFQKRLKEMEIKLQKEKEALDFEFEEAVNNLSVEYEQLQQKASIK